MKFLIKRTYKPKSDNEDARNPLWLFGVCLLCWGISLNSISKEYKPLYHRDYGSLLKDPYLDNNENLHLSDKLVVTSYADPKIKKKLILKELKKGDVIWYMTLPETGIFSQLFSQNENFEVVVFGAQGTTYLSSKDYLDSVPERMNDDRNVAILMFCIPFIYFIIRYGFIDRNKKEFGLYFYKYSK